MSAICGKRSARIAVPYYAGGGGKETNLGCQHACCVPTRQRLRCQGACGTSTGVFAVTDAGRPWEVGGLFTGDGCFTSSAAETGGHVAPRVATSTHAGTGLQVPCAHAGVDLDLARASD